ncbi:MAG: chemotaxis protein CheW [Ramlibacter sp.]
MEIPPDEGAQAKAGAIARLVEFAPGRLVALPPHTTLEVVEHPKPVTVPGAAYYAAGLLTWQDTRVPLIDLNALLRAHPGAGVRRLPRYALIVAYQDSPGSPVQRGAIGIAQLPESVTTADDACCELPGDSDLWPLISLSCFLHEGKAVPVIDTGRLFGAFHG